jgi:hypothetical protein
LKRRIERGKVKMDWTQFSIMLITMAGLFFWCRSESRSDVRHMEAIAKGNSDMILAIHQEMKDFHGRLCALEERQRGKP